MEGPWSQANVDPGASLLIPVRGTGGALVVGETTVAYYGKGPTRSAAVGATLVKVRKIEGERGEGGCSRQVVDRLFAYLCHQRSSVGWLALGRLASDRNCTAPI